jgi:hypothetical protein
MLFQDVQRVCLGEKIEITGFWVEGWGHLKLEIGMTSLFLLASENVEMPP